MCTTFRASYWGADSALQQVSAGSELDVLGPLQGNGSSYIDHSEASGRNGALVEAKADK